MLYIFRSSIRPAVLSNEVLSLNEINILELVKLKTFSLSIAGSKKESCLIVSGGGRLSGVSTQGSLCYSFLHGRDSKRLKERPWRILNQSAYASKSSL